MTRANFLSILRDNDSISISLHLLENLHGSGENLGSFLSTAALLPRQEIFIRSTHIKAVDVRVITHEVEDVESA